MEKTVDKIGEALLGDRLRHTYHYPARVHLFEEIKKAIREAVKEATMGLKRPDVKVNEVDLLHKDNHHLGCNLEGYADVLRYRGFGKEAEELDHVASKIK